MYHSRGVQPFVKTGPQSVSRSCCGPIRFSIVEISEVFVENCLTPFYKYNEKCNMSTEPCLLCVSKCSDKNLNIRDIPITNNLKIRNMTFIFSSIRIFSIFFNNLFFKAIYMELPTRSKILCQINCKKTKSNSSIMHNPFSSSIINSYCYLSIPKSLIINKKSVQCTKISLISSLNLGRDLKNLYFTKIKFSSPTLLALIYATCRTSVYTLLTTSN
ncbi:hypothetical protein AGLY_004883 [Aphis glycines]|uniref:Uncharacterized protein n=1 Tax=Aphis glycines TaxID=307491 RepID=A0A6G0TVA4_APHGL|nr:hypothetical protein AGLY_004883 [Aphis glycines]